MRILITGCTSLACGLSKLIMSNADLLQTALIQFGHTVDRRPVIVGEDLSDYDHAFICLVKLSSIAAFTHRYGALYTFTQLPDRSTVFYDDWKLASIRASLNPKYIWDYPTAKMRTAKIQALIDVSRRCYGSQFEKILSELNAVKLPQLVPAHAWGDFARLSYLGPFTPVDLTAFNTDFFTITPPRLNSKQQRRWVSAALADLKNDKDYGFWYNRFLLNTAWPVLRFEKVTGQKTKITPEVDIVATYCTSTGVVCFPHKEHIGSGWYRTRYVHAIQSGCCLFGLPQEFGRLPPEFKKDYTQIEKLNDTDLQAFIDYQRETFQKNTGTVLEAHATLERILQP